MHLRTLNKVNPADVATLQFVLESAPTYSLNVSGQFPNNNVAEEVFEALPSADFDFQKKFVLSVEINNEAIGCVDALRGFPNTQTATLGLLLISEQHQGKGFGKAAYSAFEAFVKEWEEIETVRISVVATNAGVMPFWKRLGFKETGTRRPYKNASVVSEAIVLEKGVR